MQNLYYSEIASNHLAKSWNQSFQEELFLKVHRIGVLLQIIMDRLYKAVYEKVAEGGKFQRALFNYAYEYKKNKYEAGYETPLIDRWLL